MNVLPTRVSWRRSLAGAVIVLCFGSLSASGVPAAAPSPRALLEASGVQGGLVVVVGCADGSALTALPGESQWLVQGLDTNEEHVQQARGRLAKLGTYGRVSVRHFDGKTLPYIDNLVNLVIAPADCPVGEDELLRVLRPGGVAMVGTRRLAKPWPQDIDQWTHFLHGPDNNAVAQDTRVTTPRHLQWQAEPFYLRDHDSLSSLSAMTSSNGRLFYIFDEGPTSQLHRPARWRLIARDAFNGKLLWKRAIPDWVTHLHYFRTGPVQLPRRLVSVGDRVYVMLGLTAPVSCLDAATGHTLKVFDGTDRAEEMIVHRGRLLVVLGDPRDWNRRAPAIDNYWDFYEEETPKIAKSILAVDLENGKVLWRNDAHELKGLVPLSLCACGDRVYYLDGKQLHCVDLATGEPHWSAPFPTEGLFVRNFAPTVVAREDVVACLSLRRLAVFAAGNGELKWETSGFAGFASPGDMFLIGRRLWTFPTVATVKLDPRQVPGQGSRFLALDVQTGDVVREVLKKDVWPSGHHHRCYRNKATTRFAICGRRSVEFVDTEDEDHQINLWIRGTCQYGILPCNGLVYTPPHPCQCFGQIKYDGFHAFAGQSSLDDDGEESTAGRLLRGPAYGSLAHTDASTASAKTQSAHNGSPTAQPAVFQQSSAAGPESSAPAATIWNAPPLGSASQEWPTHRHDVARSGSSPCRLPRQISLLWRRELGGKLSATTIAAGRVLLSSIDRHTLHCLEAQSGKPVWSFIADGPVDSPPTVIDGRLAVFGCTAGYVYAVRLSDGAMLWRFRAAPCERQLMDREQLQSPWPVHGAVLALGRTVYFAAGRHSMVDGGIRLYALDAFSGKLLHQARVQNPEPALADVLVFDGQSIAMRHLQFDRSLQRRQAPARGLTTIMPMLNESWFSRLLWFLGSQGGRSANRPFGQLLCFNDQTAWGLQSPYLYHRMDPRRHPPTHTGHFHQKYARYETEWFPAGTRVYAQPNREYRPFADRSEQANAKPRKRVQLPMYATDSHLWTRDLPLQLRAMVVSGRDVFVAGWEDKVGVLKGGDPRPDEPQELQPVLWRLRAEDGEVLSRMCLPARPRFDGFSVADDRLYLALEDGTVLCFGAGSRAESPLSAH